MEDRGLLEACYSSDTVGADFGNRAPLKLEELEILKKEFGIDPRDPNYLYNGALLRYGHKYTPRKRRRTTFIDDHEGYEDFDVVWNGGELLPPRSSKVDVRFDAMPSFDLEAETILEEARPKRSYNKTGRYVGTVKNGQYVPKSERRVEVDRENRESGIDGNSNLPS